METLKPLRLVSVADEALDWPAMAKAHSESDVKYANAIQEYAQSRDPDMVRETPGAKLTWFTIRRLDADIMDLVMAQSSESERARLAFQHSVTLIENLTGLDGQVRARVEPEADRSVQGIPMPYLSDRQMRWVARQYLEEIGGVAYTRSFLAPRNGVRYPLPRSWPLLLKVKAFQVAVETSSRSASSDSDRPDSEPPTPLSGEPATDAPATGEATGGSTSRSTGSAGRSKRRKPRKKKSNG